LHLDKSPREDGMTSFFYQHFWNLIHRDLISAVQSFFNSGMMLKYWNHTTITLVPKCSSPSYLNQYRPISLCSVVYKILSMLATRLKNCLSYCISAYQSAFIQDRQLLDNMISAQKVFHFPNKHRTRKNTSMALTLDLMKAFDRVEWICIEKIMIKMGFSLKFVKLLMVCISSLSLCFCVNGSLTGIIYPTRGIWQGDPLSPYLFIIVTELLITDAINGGVLSGIRLSRNCTTLSHMFFADDALFFCKAEVGQAQAHMHLLERYRLFTGQRVNLQKSSVLFRKNTQGFAQDSICSALNGIQVHSSTRYMGLPLGIDKSKGGFLICDRI
ncbi:Uncharacterized mitochondrial protein AtMg01250, partial [Striga hermonthica]